MTLPTLRLAHELESALASRHPWIYRNHLPRVSLPSGAWVRVEAGREHAVGIYDGEGAIGVRIYGRGGVPDRDEIGRRVRRAIELRDLVAAGDTDAYRVLFGEGDFLPGITVDKYERYLVAVTYSESIRTVLPDVVRALGRELQPRGIVRREGDDLEVLFGERPPPELTVREGGLRFLANPYHGQKTGLFLDQRENRATVRRFAHGRRVLNLFAYTGGFSIYALAGGAEHAVSVDLAEPALADAVRNAELNGFGRERHATLQADVFAWVDRPEPPERFGMVVVDPPSLARSKAQRRGALRAYERLNAGAMRLVESGGLLATSSCTSQVDPPAFREMLRAAAMRAGRRVQILHEAGHAPDHPVPATFPEGRYLDFVVARILED